MKFIFTIWMWLKHLMRWNRGTITTEMRGDEIWVGWACECGEVHDWHKSPIVLPWDLIRKREAGGLGGKD